ncbi:hypothetical protein [Fodinicola feengrottensis]|uniref:hypothetical protein n=1 Tax=Fodinicola feengrottensis TaxID=435914 RepID=UPI0013D86283|nr:hypothetical protein [Fodinicola feengrottensis]
MLVVRGFRTRRVDLATATDIRTDLHFNRLSRVSRAVPVLLVRHTGGWVRMQLATDDGRLLLAGRASPASSCAPPPRTRPPSPAASARPPTGRPSPAASAPPRSRRPRSPPSVVTIGIRLHQQVAADLRVLRQP